VELTSGFIHHVVETIMIERSAHDQGLLREAELPTYGRTLRSADGAARHEMCVTRFGVLVVQYPRLSF